MLSLQPVQPLLSVVTTIASIEHSHRLTVTVP